MNPIRDVLGHHLGRYKPLIRRDLTYGPFHRLEQALYGVRHMAVYGPGPLRSALDAADRTFAEFERQRGRQTIPKTVRESRALIAALQLSLDMGKARESKH